jgi:hypothetical protein
MNKQKLEETINELHKQRDIIKDEIGRLYYADAELFILPYWYSLENHVSYVIYKTSDKIKITYKELGDIYEYLDYILVLLYENKLDTAINKLHNQREKLRNIIGILKDIRTDLFIIQHQYELKTPVQYDIDKVIDKIETAYKKLEKVYEYLDYILALLYEAK